MTKKIWEGGAVHTDVTSYTLINKVIKAPPLSQYPQFDDSSMKPWKAYSSHSLKKKDIMPMCSMAAVKFRSYYISQSWNNDNYQ